MSDNFESIKLIVDRVLGSPKRDYGGSGDWYEYNCPYCAEENMGTPDDKYNMAIQIGNDGLWGHCWKCLHSDKLYKIIKKFGAQGDVEDFKEEIRAIRESKLYNLSSDLIDTDDEIFVDEELKFPEGLRPILEGDWFCKDALKYLESRGLNMKIIDEYKIGCVPPNKGRFSKRIVIPSYDEYNDLNYWVARDYTGKAKTKIFNPNVDKKSIIFNENRINWYEPITLVEGPFDHIVVPNSICLLGKTLDEDCYVFQKLASKSHSLINIMLDDDAEDDAIKMYCFLNDYFPDRVRIIFTPNSYDASDYYRDFGVKGIVKLLRSAQKLDERILSMASLGGDYSMIKLLQ